MLRACARGVATVVIARINIHSRGSVSVYSGRVGCPEVVCVLVIDASGHIYRTWAETLVV